MSNTSHASASRRNDRITLYEEYRLIEKDESEVNVAWRGIQCCSFIVIILAFPGVHLLLFFLAFVFGSFCTFCFHMLMYLFDDKCVLFPKLISLRDMSRGGSGGAGSSSQNKLLYDYISDELHTLPVDFVSTHWVEKSTCYLPTYAPLLSGICGLIWTTMFLMCSSGSRALTGLQRPWRILPTVFVFSLAMGGLSIYTSVITQSGLEELCTKLGEITGSKTCTYTINVATLAYERRIRGIYQATRLTIMSAWLHTCCWLGAAFTALIRVILVVDFRLVKVRVDLQGNIEKMLERHEKHIRTDEFSNKDDLNSIRTTSSASLKVRFLNKGFGTEPTKANVDKNRRLSQHNIQFVSQNIPFSSEMSLVPDEDRKLTIRTGAMVIPKQHRFILQMLHDIVDSIGAEPRPVSTEPTSDLQLARQQGVRNLQSALWSPSSSSDTDESVMNREEAEELARKFRHHLEHKIAVKNFAVVTPTTLTPKPSQLSRQSYANTNIKSNLKNRGVQTDEVTKTTASQKVQISSRSPSEVTLQTLKPHEEQTWMRSIDTSTVTVVTSDTKTVEVMLDAKEMSTPDKNEKILPDDSKKPLSDDANKLMLDDDKKPISVENKKSLSDDNKKLEKRSQYTTFLSSLIDTGDTIPIPPILLARPEQDKGNLKTKVVTIDVKKRLEYDGTRESGRELLQDPEPGPSRTGTKENIHKKEIPEKVTKSKYHDLEPGPSRTPAKVDIRKKKTPKKIITSKVKKIEPRFLQTHAKEEVQKKKTKKKAMNIKFSPTQTKEDVRKREIPKNTDKDKDEDPEPGPSRSQAKEEEHKKETPKKTNKKEKQD